MRKAFLLLPIYFLLLVPTTGQIEHAPTPEQCRADADVWNLPKWSFLVQNQNEFARLSVVERYDRNVTAKVLEARIAELNQCEKTDNTQSARYAQGIRTYAIAEMARMTDYIQRHGLAPQFYQEDDQGQR